MPRYLLFFICVSLQGCTHQPERGKLLPHSEPVLQPKDTIVVNHPVGSLEIQAVSAASRRFVSDGWEIELDLIPRKSRWDGSAGRYDPATSSVPYGRLIFEEGRQFFSSESEALRFLNLGG